MKYNYEDNMAYFSAPVVEDEAVALDENYELFIQTIANIRNGVEGGILSAEEGKEKEAEALIEYQARLAGILEVDYDEDEYEDEDAEYSSSDFDVANFEAGNNFGQAVMELAAEEYEDPLDALVDIADEFDLTDEQVVGLIQGVYAPDAELAQAIGSFFETTSTDEDAFLGLMVLAQEAAETVLETEEDEEYDSDADTEILPDEDGEDEAEYEDEEASYKMAELEDRIANFEAASVIDATLSEFESEAERGFREGWLTPKQKKMLLGNFRSSSERLAKFSETCDQNEISPDMQLYAIDYTLKVLEAAGPVAKFGQYVEQEVDDVSISAEKTAEQQARLNFQLMKERK